MNVKTRFPPSPTGYLHIGGLRTALYNEYFAKKNGGSFVLRIEDTDRERYVPGAVESLIRTLDRMGITYQEGPILEDGELVQQGDHGPYIQSMRQDLYKQYADQLLNEGKAYRCFCSKDRLDSLRKQQQLAKLQPKYDRLCCELSEDEIKVKMEANEPHVVRMQVPEGETTFKDEIRGNITISHQEIDDQVILKSDGYPTYHLAVVVDDHSMGITHVIRGEEWISSTPKHILLYQMLGWELPTFAHLPLILNPDKSKLSKRQGDVAVEDYLDKGYLPEALINFVSLLGFNPSGEQELYSKQELIDSFDLASVNKGGAVFSTEKLDWMNGQYIRQMPNDELAAAITPFLEKAGKGGFEEILQKAVAVEKERLTTLADMSDKIDGYLEIPEYDPIILIWKKSDREGALKELQGAREFLTNLNERFFESAEVAETAVKGYIEDNGLQNGNVLWPLRVALSGNSASPSPFELLWVFQKDESLKRIQTAIERLSA